MAASKNKPAKSPARQPAKQRVRKAPQYKHFRLSKRIKPAFKPLSGGVRLFIKSLKLLRRHWKFVGGVTLIYGALNILLVRGFSSDLGLTELKASLEDLFEGGWGDLAAGTALFGVLLTSSGSEAGAASGAYQVVLVLITSLALIWGFRQLQAGIAIRVKDAFYKGVYPLVPFILVLLVIGLQFLPLIIAGTIFSMLISSGLAITPAEQVISAVIFGLFALLSLYMVSSSVFALYIVTLPDMTPMKALRSARQLVLHRRWVVMRKVVLLPLLLLIVAGLIMIPLIMFATGWAEWAYFGLTMLGLALIHAYMYTLYRELL